MTTTPAGGDIALQVNGDQEIDLAIIQNDLAIDDGLETSVIVSLFSDKRVTAEELSQFDVRQTDLRGWWGDEFADDEGDQIGSKLWLLDRSKIIQETLNQAQEFAADALQWMIDDGIATSISCSASWDINQAMVLQVLIYRPGQNAPYKFTKKWNTEATREG